jgi:Fe2+ or Zn2+ uptake regulation protein
MFCSNVAPQKGQQHEHFIFMQCNSQWEEEDDDNDNWVLKIPSHFSIHLSLCVLIFYLSM